MTALFQTASSDVGPAVRPVHSAISLHAGLALTGTLPGGCRRRNFGRRPVGWWERSPALRALAAPE